MLKRELEANLLFENRRFLTLERKLEAIKKKKIDDF